MPGLAHRNDQCCNATSSSPAASANSFWSKNRGDVCYNQLQKFWSDLSPRAREELLRIDKQMLFEQARKNMYCSRCNGLLLEGFLQIVMYGKSFHQEGAAGQLSSVKSSASRIMDDSGLSIASSCQEEIQDPSVHPWGGLTTTRDGSLTLLDCYLYSKSLRGLQIVFDSARARERERELLYPDACGGGGRGWISQGVAAYGRGHGIRESCALHTARLSCDTLVDFWSALGDETRQSLLRMKEEDFIERLVYRFDSKRFCRDCRRNVIREFKELKELKRMRREPRCTSCFCVADTAFQYEVSDDTIQADWHQTFADSFGSYHHFEWAVGTGEGKSDILESENIGLNGSIQVSGLDLSDLNACFITLKAWKFDGRCTELSVKAHALKGQQCVHSRLVVGDGFVSITRGESIRSFFEHAEEAEEEEDDDSTDRDGNDLDGECSRPQKHAKSPELAREFLLDAAIVIFKEQVEKAFREGTARQNAHSIFVCLSLKLLEERVHIACKEIITLEKQMKLLEEEEKEKREEEERKERRRTKEREKKLRRKERQKGKEKDREKKDSEVDVHASCDASKEETSPSANKEPSKAVSYDASINESADIINPMPISSDTEEVFTTGYSPLQTEDVSCENPEADSSNVKEENESFMAEHSKSLHRRINSRKERQPETCFKWSDRQRYSAVLEGGMLCNKTDPRYHGDNFVTRSRGVYGAHRQVRTNMTKTNFHSSGSKCGEKFHSSNNRMNDRYDNHSCSCNQLNEYRERMDSHVSNRAVRDSKFVVKSESVLDMSKHSYRGNRYSQADNIRQGSTRTKSKVILANNSRSNVLYPKKVWEPMELQKKYSRSSSDSDVTLMSSSFKVEADTSDSTKSSGENCSSEDSGDSSEVIPKNSSLKESRDSIGGMDVCQNGLKDPGHSTEAGDQEADSCLVGDSSFNRISDTRISSTSNSDNCSLCLSEVDSNASSSNHGNPGSSSTSDSEDAPQQLERTKTPSCNGTSGFHKAETEEKDTTSRMGLGGQTCIPVDGNGSISGTPLVKGSQPSSNINSNPLTGSKHQPDVFQMHHQNLYCQLFQGPSVMGYYPQNYFPWSPVPTNGLMQFAHPNNYMYAGPFGYGIDGNHPGVCMQYEAMQHLTPPLFNAGPLPVYQPSAKANGVYYEEKTQIPKQSSPVKTLNGVNGEKCVPSVTKNTDVSQDGEDGQRNSSAKMSAETTGFSLFHFGGPVALSNIKSNKPSEEAAIKDIASKVATDAVQGNHILNKKETVEEYNLFAGSNRTRFQFF